MNTGLASDIPANSNIIISLPFYDIGWIPVGGGVTCAIVGIPVQCQTYANFDWILIQTQTLISKTTQNIWTFNNLQVPTYANNALGIIQIRVLDGASFIELYIINEQTFPTPTTPQLLTAIILAPIKGTGYVNCPYSFQFKALNAIFAGSVIIITFPSNYNLLGSNPSVSFSSPQLTSISLLLSIKFTAINIQQLQITNFNTIPAQNTFSIQVNGLKNPITGSTSTGWNIQITYNNFLVTNKLSFDSFSFTSTFKSGTIIFNNITAFPTNANQLADYTISFTPRTTIPIGGKILITFPSGQFKVLPSPPSCYISGGVSTFLSCTLQGTTFVIVMDSSYDSGGLLVLITDLMNPDMGTTDGFTISTYYDGVYLDQTDTTTLTDRIINITAQSATISVLNLDFSPKNEGEPATYTFSFLTTNILETNMQILIIFPLIYDSLLGPSISCESTSGLIGTLACTVQNLIVSITGFQAYIPNADKPISINIYGVINPNRNINFDSGQFGISSMVVNSGNYVDSNDAAGSLVILSAPGWSTLFNITADNYNTRLTANYLINFTANVLIPKTTSNGAIFVDFPSQFNIPSGVLNCDTNNTGFAYVLFCNVNQNRVTVTGHTQSFSGNLQFYVRQILNPVDQGGSDNVYIKTYDGFNQVIIERSYSNLDPFSFDFIYPGPLIHVYNDEDIVVQRGTQSPTLYVSLDYPCALNLTLKPTLPGFSIIPYNIQLSLGQIQSAFVVSIPESFAIGTYYIIWETLGDLVPAFYTPLKQTRVNVTTNQNIMIAVPVVYDVPYGGNSLPSSFQVPYAPDIGFVISLNFMLNYPGISVDKTSVVFSAGMLEANFIIYSSNNSDITGGVIVSGGTLVLSLSGVNSDIYILSQTSLIFNVINADFTQPEITQIAVTGMTQTSAILTVGTSEVCIAYYMIALAGTAAPGLDEVMNQGPPSWNTTDSVYGTFLIPLPSNMANTILENLIAQTPYAIYVYVINRGGQVSPVKSITFSTLSKNSIYKNTHNKLLDRYLATSFSLQFNQAYLNTAEKENIILATAFVLSLNPMKYMTIYV